jgi:membrane protein DedA with SNARE-associated domain
VTLPLESLPESVAYLAVFVAAALEGEVIFVSSCVLVSQGKLNGVGVLLAAALGGSLGDQVYFYALHGRLSNWLGRIRMVAERQEKVVTHIRSHSTRIILASRFLPGLRIAIPSACAYAGVPPLKFTLLSLCSGFAWATSLTVFVGYLGPQALTWLGLGSWGRSLIPVALVLGYAFWMARSFSRSFLKNAPASTQRSPVAFGQPTTASQLHEKRRSQRTP